MKTLATIKLIIISIAVIMILTFLTVDVPVKSNEKDIHLSNLPKTVELMGYENQKFNTNSIIKENTIIFVGNYESIVLSEHLEKTLKLPISAFFLIINLLGYINEKPI